MIVAKLSCIFHYHKFMCNNLQNICRLIKLFLISVVNSGCEHCHLSLIFKYCHHYEREMVVNFVHPPVLI